MASTWYWPQLKGGLAPDRSSVIVSGTVTLMVGRRAESTYCCCATSHSAMPENPFPADEVGARREDLRVGVTLQRPRIGAAIVVTGLGVHEHALLVEVELVHRVQPLCVVLRQRLRPFHPVAPPAALQSSSSGLVHASRSGSNHVLLLRLLPQQHAPDAQFSPALARSQLRLPLERRGLRGPGLGVLGGPAHASGLPFGCRRDPLRGPQLP